MGSRANHSGYSKAARYGCWSIFFGMFMGPLGLMITFFLCECAKHGLKFK